MSSRLLLLQLQLQLQLLLLLACSTVTSSDAPPYMDIGILYTQCTASDATSGAVSQDKLLSRFQAEIALRMAVSEINNKSDGIHDSILPDTILQSHFLSFNSSSDYVDGLFISKQYPLAKLYAIIDHEDSEAGWGSIPYTSENDIFRMGYKNIYEYGSTIPSRGQSNPAVENEGKLMAVLAHQYHYRKVVVFYSSMFVENIYSFVNFEAFAPMFNIEIASAIDINGLSRAALVQLLEAQTSFNVYIFFVHAFQAAPLFEVMFQESFFRRDIQLLGSSVVLSNDMWRLTNLTDQEIAYILTGYIGLEKHCLDLDTDFTSRFLMFQNQLKVTQGKSSQCFNLFENVSHHDAFAVHAYNSVLGVAMGINALVTGPQACANDDINSERELFALLNSASVEQSDITADLLQRVVLLCTPFRGSNDYISVDNSLVNWTMAVVNFDGLKYFDSPSVDSDDMVKASSSFCPQSAIRGMNIIGAVDAATLIFTTCEDYFMRHGVNLSFSCSRNILFNTDDNSIPVDHYPEKYESIIDKHSALLLTMIVLGSVFTVTCGIIIFKNRTLRIVRIAQPELLYFVLGGVLCSFVAAALVLHREMSCYYLQWAISMSYSLTLVPLCLSVWRMHTVLKRGRKRIKKISVGYMIKFVLALIGVKILILSCYTLIGVSSGETLRTVGVHASGGEYSYCVLLAGRSSHIVFNVIGVLNVLFSVIVFLLGVYFSFSAKSTPIAENLANRTLKALSVIFWSICCALVLQYVVENSIVSIYIYRMFIVVGFIFMGLYLQYVLCQQILLYIVQGYDLNRKFVRVRNREGFSFLKFFKRLLKTKPKGLLQIRHATVRNEKKDPRPGDGGEIEIKYSVRNTTSERAQSVDSISISNRDNSGFVRVVNVLDLDERYQIQLQLQQLYNRLDQLVHKVENPGNHSGGWSNEEKSDERMEEENDHYVIGNDNEHAYNLKLRMSRLSIVSGKGGAVMESVVEEDIADRFVHGDGVSTPSSSKINRLYSY